MPPPIPAHDDVVHSESFLRLLMRRQLSLSITSGVAFLGALLALEADAFRGGERFVLLEDRDRDGRFQLLDERACLVELVGRMVRARRERHANDDRVDILVDLSGHTDGNRLLMFARKPAPIQVTAWGYSTGTGIPAIDYLFHDTVGVPPAARPLFAERIADLPCQVGFEAPPDSPGIGASPAMTRGYVTFGCFNRLFKVSAGAIGLWSKILLALPGSRLLLKDRLLDLAAPRATMIDAFAKRGIGTDHLRNARDERIYRLSDDFAMP